MFKGSVYKLGSLLLLLTGATVLAVWSISSEKLILLFLALPVLIGTFIGLFRLHYQNIRKMTFMFNAIENGDYAFKFTEYEGPVSDNLLNLSLNRIKEILIKAKIEAIEREKYYELILNSVNTGVIVLNHKGNIYQINNEALRLFGLSQLNHINQLRIIEESLPTLFLNLKAGEKRQTSFCNERGTIHLALGISEMRVRETPLRIVAMNDINNELDEKETESWIRLIRVLTHEIMNSITPITSLSDTLLHLNESIDPKVKEGIEVINSTSRSLINFVESYRSVTRIPTPRFKSFYAKSFLERMVTLIRHDPPEEQITIVTEVTPDDLLLYADESLMGQVVLNLLKNAVHALSDQQAGKITISASENPSGEITVDITDNGKGVPPEIAANIFVPFFTTKHNGSGIGLSVSRQIMRLHNGSISLKTTQPGCTTFRLRLS